MQTYGTYVNKILHPNNFYALDAWMTHFGQTLTYVLSQTGISQLDVAHASDITGPQISRYTRGENHPEFKSIVRIIGQFDDYYRALLICAYLRDQVPAIACDQVHFLFNKFHFPISTPGGKKLPADFLKAVECLQLHGLVSKAVRYAIISLVRTLRK